MSSTPLIAADRFDAVLFDLDGVLTDTAKAHATCWKKMFDEFLQKRAARPGESPQPFDIVQDYQHYVDGKLRDDGVRSFLASRGITLPRWRRRILQIAKQFAAWGTAKMNSFKNYSPLKAWRSMNAPCVSFEFRPCAICFR